MFGISEQEKKYFLERFQEVPKRVLTLRFQDGGLIAAKYVNTALEIWKYKHAKFSNNGKLLARPKRSVNGLLGYLGLKETSKKLVSLEPWQVCDHFGVSSNFDLIYAIYLNPFLDEDGLLKSVLEKLDEEIFWATVVCHMSEKADLRALLNVFANFSHASYLKSRSREMDLDMKIEPMLKAFLQEQKRLKNFVRPADKGKEQKLRDATETYRKRHPNRSQHGVASALAKDASIGLGITRIKEYFGIWFTRENWPKTPAGRKAKQLK